MFDRSFSNSKGFLVRTKLSARPGYSGVRGKKHDASSGHYSAILDTGTYLINCRPPVLWLGPVIEILTPFPLYLPKWYKDAYDPAQATPVAVTEGGKDTIDFALARYVIPTLVHLRGTVSDSSGNPLKGALVTIQRTMQEMPLIAATDAEVTNFPGELCTVDGLGCIQGVVWKGWTDSTGAFDATVLSGRSYTAMAADKGYFPQFYDHKSNPADATIIHVTGDVNNINFNLNPYRPPEMYSLSGVVRDSSGVRVPSRILVFPLHPWLSHSEIRFGYTDSLGAFTIGKLRAGDYFVLAIPFGDYAPAFYKAGAYGVIHWKNADTVHVTADVAGIDIGVIQNHGSGVTVLRGTVTSLGQAVQGVNLLAQEANGNVVGFGITDDAGAYTINALPAGSITIIADQLGYTSAQYTLAIKGTDYALTQDFTLGTATAVTTSGSSLPRAFGLEQNYPNPFNPSTVIEFTLPNTAIVDLKVFNVLGQEVATLANGTLTAGQHSVTFDASNLASGVYLYRITAGSFVSTKKMLLLK